MLDAVLHCLVRGHSDSLTMSLLTALFGGLLALPLLALTGLPDPAALPWLALSVALGMVYSVALGRLYRQGPLGVLMPLTRGVAILISTVAAALLMGEVPGLETVATVLCVAAGLAVLALWPGQARLSGAGLRGAAQLACIISAFTLVDATGVRLAGDPLAYGAALYLGCALGIAGYAARFQRAAMRRLDRAALGKGVVTAGLSMGGYLMVLAALAEAPVAPVAALAETSIVFAVVLGTVWLREPARVPQLVGVAMIVAGMGALRLVA